jgi:hypothetical protein
VVANGIGLIGVVGISKVSAAPANTMPATSRNLEATAFPRMAFP